MEEAFEYILEQLAITFEHGRQLLGVGLVARHVLLGEIENAGDVLHLALRNLEHLLEGVHLVHGDDAVGLGHLGAKRDHAHGEGDLILRRTILLLIAIDGVMPRHATKQRTNRATDREPRGSAGQLPPNRHCQEIL